MMNKKRSKKKTVLLVDVLPIILIVIVVVFVAAFVTVAMVRDSKKCKIYDSFIQSGAPEYLDKVVLVESHDLAKEFELKATQPDAKFNETVAEVKGKIRAKYGQYQSLNWSRFDQIKVKMTGAEHEFIGAMYYEPANTVYVSRKIIDMYSDEYHEIVAHEFIHSLTKTDANCSNYYLEGFTEYLAQQVYETECASYINTYIFAEAYVTKYGLERAISDYMTGTAQLDIDEKLGLPGASDNVATLAFRIDSQYNPEAFPESVIADVYYHYSKALGVDVPSHSQKYLELMFRVSGVSSETLGYLKKI